MAISLAEEYLSRPEELIKEPKSLQVLEVCDNKTT